MATAQNLVDLARQHIADSGVGAQVVEVHTPDGKVYDVVGVDVRVTNGRSTNLMLTVEPFPEGPAPEPSDHPLT